MWRIVPKPLYIGRSQFDSLLYKIKPSIPSLLPVELRPSVFASAVASPCTQTACVSVRADPGARRGDRVRDDLALPAGPGKKRRRTNRALRLFLR